VQIRGTAAQKGAGENDRFDGAKFHGKSFLFGDTD
jgi:hypothetical protein